MAQPTNPVVAACESQAWHVLHQGVSEYKSEDATKNMPLPTIAEVTVNTSRAPFKDYGEKTFTQEAILFEFERTTGTGWTLRGHRYKYFAATA